MSEKIPARFRKTKTDKWAVMAPVEDLEKALADGGTIEVQRKSGDWGTFVVGSLGRPFDVDGVSMCYGYAPGDGDPGADSGGGQAPARSQGTHPDRAPAPARARAPRKRAEPPPPDAHEPLPTYQGGAEDEWSGEF